VVALVVAFFLSITVALNNLVRVVPWPLDHLGNFSWSFSPRAAVPRPGSAISRASKPWPANGRRTHGEVFVGKIKQPPSVNYGMQSSARSFKRMQAAYARVQIPQLQALSHAISLSRWILPCGYCRFVNQVTCSQIHRAWFLMRWVVFCNSQVRCQDGLGLPLFLVTRCCSFSFYLPMLQLAVRSGGSYLKAFPESFPMFLFLDNKSFIRRAKRCGCDV
jgi:hypothetical protein